VLYSTVLTNKRKGYDIRPDPDPKPGWLNGEIDGVHGLSSRTHRLKDGSTEKEGQEGNPKGVSLRRVNTSA
jgi:hypothetical protein